MRRRVIRARAAQGTIEEAAALTGVVSSPETVTIPSGLRPIREGEQDDPIRTYVGDICRALFYATNDDENIIEFGAHPVPQAVYDLLDSLELNYTLPAKRGTT